MQTEHLDHPVNAILEFKRLAKKLVVIKVPNGVAFKWRNSGLDHVYSWTEYTFHNLLSKYFPKVLSIRLLGLHIKADQGNWLI